MPYKREQRLPRFRPTNIYVWMLQWFFPIVVMHTLIILAFWITLHETKASWKGTVFTQPYLYGLKYKRFENTYGYLKLTEKEKVAFDASKADEFERYLKMSQPMEAQPGKPAIIAPAGKVPTDTATKENPEERATNIEMSIYKIPFLIAFAFGFLGTLIYTLKDVAYRFYTADLYPKTFVSYVIRFIFAPCICIVIAYFIMNDWWVNGAPILFFLIGYFPDRGLQFIEETVMKYLKLEKKDLGKDIPLGIIQGMSDYIVYRFKEIGIDNAQNLAYVDLDKVRENIGYDDSVLCDFVSQAILLVHLRDHFLELQGAGIRNIISFKERITTEQDALDISKSLNISFEKINSLRKILEKDEELQSRVKKIQECIMEFLKVTVPGRKDRDINVLIDGEKSGKINEVIILGRGDILVSVDLPGAEEKVVDLRNTTPSHPKIVEIKV